jgi:hypothetical protein
LILTGNKHLSAGALIDEAGSVSVDRSVLVGQDGTTFVDGFTNNINDPAKSLGANGHENGVTGVHNGLSANQTFGGVEGDGSDVVAAQMLGNLEDESVSDALNFESVENRGKGSLELHIDDGTNNLGNLSVSDFRTKGTYPEVSDRVETYELRQVLRTCLNEILLNNYYTMFHLNSFSTIPEHCHRLNSITN